MKLSPNKTPSPSPPPSPRIQIELASVACSNETEKKEKSIDVPLTRIFSRLSLSLSLSLLLSFSLSPLSLKSPPTFLEGERKMRKIPASIHPSIPLSLFIPLSPSPLSTHFFSFLLFFLVLCQGGRGRRKKNSTMFTRGGTAIKKSKNIKRVLFFFQPRHTVLKIR